VGCVSRRETAPVDPSLSPSSPPQVKEQLATIFTAPITMFSMNKQIGKHLLADDE
jgi:hypothetical protein